MAPGVQDPAVVQGHEGVSGCGGRVLPALGVRVLQRGELVLPQNLVHHERPFLGEHGVTSACKHNEETGGHSWKRLGGLLFNSSEPKG